MRQFDVRREAVANAHSGYGQTMVQVYVGDQLKRIADALEAKPAPAPDDPSGAIPRPDVTDMKRRDAEWLMADDRFEVVDIKHQYSNAKHIVSIELVQVAQ